MRWTTYKKMKKKLRSAIVWAVVARQVARFFRQRDNIVRIYGQNTEI